jgi:hypothetical protein
MLVLLLARMSAAIAPRYEPSPTGDAVPSDDKLLRGWTPRPTTAPAHARFGGVELLKRELGTRTCGFIAARGVYWACTDGYKCINVGTIRDCCASTAVDAECAATLLTTCLPYSLSSSCVASAGVHTLCW